MSPLESVQDRHLFADQIAELLKMLIIFKLPFTRRHVGGIVAKPENMGAKCLLDGILGIFLLLHRRLDRPEHGLHLPRNTDIGIIEAKIGEMYNLFVLLNAHQKT